MASVLFKIVRICNSLFKCKYLKFDKLFQNFLFHFWNLPQILNIFKKRMIIIANVFPKLGIVKIWFRLLSKKRCFRTRFDSQHVEASQTLAKFQWECFCHDFSPFSGKWIWKISTLVLRESLVLFVNRLTANGKYPVQDCESLPLPIQMQLSEKQKTSSQCFVPFLESTSNFTRFEKKDECYS